MNNNDVINKINTIIVETEEFNNIFLPIESTLNPIKNDIIETLNRLKESIHNAQNTSDKVHYINRYTDLVKKVESIFETKNKRLLQTLQTLSKLPNMEQQNLIDNDVKDGDLTPEQCNEIFKIINRNKED